MIFDTYVADIPCKCEVVLYTGYAPMRITGTGFGDADPPEEEEFEFEILDRTGHRARWLESKINESDEMRLLREYKELKDEN